MLESVNNNKASRMNILALTNWGQDKMSAIFHTTFPIHYIPAYFQVMAWRRPDDT